jgi:iron complex outermembrane receptor protein
VIFVGKKNICILIFLISIQTLYAAEKQLRDSVRVDTTALKNIELDDILVTSYRYNNNVRQVAAPVQIIAAKSIENNDIGNVSAMLNTLSGINMQSGTFQTTKLTIRGIGSRSPYSTNRTRAYLDGIPLTTGDGTTVIDDVELTFIDKIEVTKGSHSSWYGSGMGGSIRFVSKQNSEKKFQASSQYSIGSFGLDKFSLHSQIPQSKGFLNLGFARISGDGYRQNSNFYRNSVMLSGEFTQKSKLNYILVYSDVDAKTPSSINEETFVNNPENAATNWLDVKGYKKYKRLLGGLSAETPIGKFLKNKLTVSSSVYDQYELRPFNILDDNALSFSLQENLMYSHSAFSFSAGLEWLHENYFWRILENNSFLEKQKSKELRNQYNAYFNVETKLHPNLSLSLAGNLNATTYTISDLFVNDATDYSGRFFNKMIFSPKLGINYRHNQQISLYASVGHGFSNPTVEESLNSAGFLNSNLKPEQGWTVDVGTKIIALSNTLFFDASAYYILLHNLLVTKRISEELFFGENAGTSSLKGLEFQLKYRPVELFQLTASLNGSQNKFKSFISDGIDYAGKELPGIPSINSHVDLQTRLFKKLQLNALYSYSGSQYLNDANSASTNDWQTLNLRAAYTLKIAKKFDMECIAAINNIFDERYASMVLINAPSFGGRAPRYYYPGMPRNVHFTLKIKMR